MAHEVVLGSSEKTKYFICLSPTQFWSLYDFLGPAKWNELKGYGEKLNHSISSQVFKSLFYYAATRLRRGFNILTIAHHWYGVSEYSVRMVSEFRTFKNICASVDCTEFKWEMPQNYSQQENI